MGSANELVAGRPSAVSGILIAASPGRSKALTVLTGCEQWVIRTVHEDGEAGSQVGHRIIDAD